MVSAELPVSSIASAVAFVGSWAVIFEPQCKHAIAQASVEINANAFVLL